MTDVTTWINALEKCRVQSVNMGLKGAFFDTVSIDEIARLLKEQQEEIEKLQGFVNGFSHDAIVPVCCKDCIFGKLEKNDSTGIEWIYCQHHRENRPKDWYCASASRID